MTTKTYTNTVRDFVSMADAMNRMFDARTYDYARNGGHSGGQNGDQAKRTYRLPVDAWTKDDAFVIRAFLPGVDADAVEITFEGEDLTIRGTFPAAAEEVDFVKRELFHGAFERRLTFNVPVDVEHIEAVFANGVLTLTVPKVEEVRPKQIKVQVK